jgi:DNA-binding Xre family transcriptional regulator
MGKAYAIRNNHVKVTKPLVLALAEVINRKHSHLKEAATIVGMSTENVRKIARGQRGSIKATNYRKIIRLLKLHGLWCDDEGFIVTASMKPLQYRPRKKKAKTPAEIGVDLFSTLPPLPTKPIAGTVWEPVRNPAADELKENTRALTVALNAPTFYMELRVPIKTVFLDKMLQLSMDEDRSPREILNEALHSHFTKKDE